MIPLHRPALCLGRVLGASLGATEGRSLRGLEAAYTEASGGAWAVWLPSARAGICWALRAAIQNRDNVIGPAFTCSVVWQQGIYTISLWTFPPHLDREQFPVTYRLSSEVINLPLSPWMSTEHVDRVCEPAGESRRSGLGMKIFSHRVAVPDGSRGLQSTDPRLRTTRVA